MKEEHRLQLLQGLQQLQLDTSSAMLEKQLEFVFLLEKWNKAYNLTAVKTFAGMLTHHLLDSLAVAPYIHGQRILDVGTGAGFPGVPLAIYYPHKQFVLLDSNGKKIRFLLQSKSELRLTNISCEQNRMQNFNSDTLFDGIICRAVGNMNTIRRETNHLLKQGGQWLFMKGGDFLHEIEELQQEHTVIELKIPALEAKRHLIVVDKIKE